MTGSSLNSLPPIIKKMLQFGQKSVESKNFYRTKRISNVSNVDCDKIVVSNSISCNKGKD